MQLGGTRIPAPATAGGGRTAARFALELELVRRLAEPASPDGPDEASGRPTIRAALLPLPAAATPPAGAGAERLLTEAYAPAMPAAEPEEAPAAALRRAAANDAGPAAARDAAPGASAPAAGAVQPAPLGAAPPAVPIPLPIPPRSRPPINGHGETPDRRRGRNGASAAAPDEPVAAAEGGLREAMTLLALLGATAAAILLML